MLINTGLLVCSFFFAKYMKHGTCCCSIKVRLIRNSEKRPLDQGGHCPSGAVVMLGEEDQGMRPPPSVGRGNFDVLEHFQGVLDGQKTQKLSH